MLLIAVLYVAVVVSFGGGSYWTRRAHRDPFEPVSEEETIRRYYRWWTSNVSGEHLKVGPIAFSWYRFVDGRWHFEAIWLCRHSLFVVPKLA